MTTQLPYDVLIGRPEPIRTRWQPLRGGIVNLFRYDEQTFAFHHGRVLLRGNNGSGKSMALEVLLPFVLDAELKPSRMSTFGGKERNMYLWLLGFDHSGSRNSERAYVWVEFGRRHDDGSAEYFTAGAMLEGTRDSDVRSTWWTTAARIGVELALGGPGSEPLSKNLLTEALALQTAAGRPGRVHPDAKSHRKTVNENLYGLSERRFAVLRDTLLQLRRPKLSDKLNANNLNDILRDSLPPIAEVTVAELAEGFERLDRHADAVRDMQQTIGNLCTLQRAYRSYSRIAGAARADAIVSAETAVDSVRSKMNSAQTAITAAETALASLALLEEQIATRLAAIRGRVDIVTNLEAYRQFGAVEPLRNLVDTLRKVWTGAVETGRRAEQRAAADERAAERAADASRQAQQAHADSRGEAAAVPGAAFCITADEQARAGVGDLLGREVADADALDDVLSDAATLVTRLTTQLTKWQQTVTELTGLAAAAAQATSAAVRASQETARAQSEMATAEQHLNDALDADRAAVLAWIEQIKTWTAASEQLRAGQAPPLPWESDTAIERVPRWAAEAQQTRTTQLLADAERLRSTAVEREATASITDTLAARLTDVAAAADRAESADHTLSRERIAFRGAVGRWGVGLTQLPRALAMPDWAGVDDDTLSQTAATWAAQAGQRRGRTLAAEQEALRAKRDAAEDGLRALREREQRLSLPGMPEVDVPMTRGHSRDARIGAPLYLLLDFQPGTPHIDQLGVEAALIGSGLADAWLYPEGRLHSAADDQLLLDTQLAADALVPAGSNLGDILVADPACAEHGLSVAIVDAILSRVAYTGSDAGRQRDGAGLLVGADGSWRSGPLTGAHAIETVTLVGASNRETERLTRLERVRADIEATLLGIDALGERATELAATLAAVDTERAALPPAETLRSAQQEGADAFLALIRAADMAGVAMTVLESRIETHLGGMEPDEIETARTLMSRWILVRAVIDTSPAAGHGRSLGLLVEAATAAAADVRRSAAQLRKLADEQSALVQTVAAERDAMPRTTSVTTARQQLQTTLAQVQSARERVATRQQEEELAQRVKSDASELVASAVAQQDLPADTDPHVLHRAVASYRAAAETWLHDAVDAIRAAGNDTLAFSAALATREDAEAAEQQAQAHHSTFLQKQAALEELTASYGADYAEIATELGNLASEQKALEDDEVKRRVDHTAQVAGVAKATAELASAEQERAGADGVRAEAGAAFLAAWRTGVLAAGDLPVAAPGIEGAADDVSAPIGVRVVRDWARAVRDSAGDKLARSVTDVDQAANKLTETRYSLEPSLAGRVSVRDEHRDGLLMLMATRSARTLLLPEMITVVGEELASSEKLVAHEEAELFRKFLADDTRREVTTKVRDARTAVAAMAELMAKHPTGSGIQVQLVWVPDERNAPGMQQIVRLMGKDAPLDSEKERLQQFFRERIDRVRADPDTDYTAQMAELLDYRQWWRFQVQFRRHGSTDWEALTSKSHGALSGGEKAVCLHLPLFAAAAAYCDSAGVRCRDGDGADAPGAPRLILLDEVFAGVDEDNRGELFDIIRRLDLDMVATSENEQGLYAQLDGIAIYQLVAEEGIDAILAARTIWDGTSAHHMLDDDMFDPDATPDLFDAT
jgi:Putative exonuclease SbcCD, C subunit